MECILITFYVHQKWRSKVGNWGLFLDDIRFVDYNKKFQDYVAQNNMEWHLAKTSEEAIALCLMFGCPTVVSFDHDLGEDDTAMRLIHWMIDIDMNEGGEFIPSNFGYWTHSANPVGVANIRGLIDSYLTFKEARKYTRG
jgi:hypothetical protein